MATTFQANLIGVLQAEKEIEVKREVVRKDNELVEELVALVVKGAVKEEYEGDVGDKVAMDVDVKKAEV